MNGGVGHGEYKRCICNYTFHCSFSVVLEGFPKQKALTSGGLGELWRSPIPPSWCPPPAPSPGWLRLQSAPPLFSPPPPTVQAGSANVHTHTQLHSVSVGHTCYSNGMFTLCCTHVTLGPCLKRVEEMVWRWTWSLDMMDTLSDKC